MIANVQTSTFSEMMLEPRQWSVRCSRSSW